MLRFKLNDTYIDNPRGWDSISLALRRDLELNFIYCAYEGELVFTNEAYNILYDIYKTDSFCSIVPLLIEYQCNNGNWDILSVCNIIISDCEFNRFRCECKAKIVDDTWGSRINNNKNVPYNLGYKKTKNGYDLVAPEKEYVKFFDASGAYIYDDRIGFSVYNVFKSVVGFITDNNVVFKSDYFETGDGQYIYIFTGSSIRGSNAIYAEISLNTLYQELHKKLRLGMMFYVENGINYVRVENADYFYQSGVSLNFDNVKDLVESFDLDRLYSTIVVGSSNCIQIDQCNNGGTDCVFGQVPFYTWDNEEVAILNKECNIDKKLDLLTKPEIVIDSNIIQNLLSYTANVRQWDENIFFVSCQLDGYSIKAIPTDFFGVNLYWYNDIFSNKNVLYNWFSGIGNIYSTYLQNYLRSYVYAAFLEQQTVAYGAPFPPFFWDTLIEFPVDDVPPFSDDFGLWVQKTGTLANTYIVPFTANYTIELNLSWDDAAYPDPPTGTPKAFILRTQFHPYANILEGSFNIDSSDSNSLTITIFAYQGDTISVFLGAQGIDPVDPDIYYKQFDEGTIKIFSTIDNVIPPTQTENFLGRKVTFEKFISYEDLKAIKANPIMKLGVNQDQLVKFDSWISEATINVKTLKGNFVLTNK